MDGFTLPSFRVAVEEALAAVFLIDMASSTALDPLPVGEDLGVKGLPCLPLFLLAKYSILSVQAGTRCLGLLSKLSDLLSYLNEGMKLITPSLKSANTLLEAFSRRSWSYSRSWCRIGLEAFEGIFRADFALDSGTQYSALNNSNYSTIQKINELYHDSQNESILKVRYLI